ncbi:MAG TPA: alpha/beta hydrolase [Sphingomicrobium sp.]|nr:alpha/beta hydrolase [Sphingomicrobium sp.]
MSDNSDRSLERRTFLGGSLAMIAAAAAAQQPDAAPYSTADPKNPLWPAKERFALWPGQPPGAPARKIAPNWSMNGAATSRELWIRGVAMPEVHVFLAAHSDGSSLLAIPGGGYEFLSVQNEGMDAAERFNAERTSVFVLTYRLPAEGWATRSLVPLQDAQRAMRLIRSRANEFRIDPSRLGVIGFSAGGHLAADLAVSFDQRIYTPVDGSDELPARPAFVGLIYPVTTMEAGTHGGSRNNLLGPSPSAELIATRSPVLHVSASTPPSFLVAAFDDDTVPIDNTLNWIAASRKEKVSVEAHLLAEGGHGFGFHLPSGNPGSKWPDLFALWAREHGA